jgi:hypothetical protein
MNSGDKTLCFVKIPDSKQRLLFVADTQFQIVLTDVQMTKIVVEWSRRVIASRVSLCVFRTS